MVARAKQKPQSRSCFIFKQLDTLYRGYNISLDFCLNHLVSLWNPTAPFSYFHRMRTYLTLLLTVWVEWPFTKPATMVKGFVFGFYNRKPFVKFRITAVGFYWVLICLKKGLMPETNLQRRCTLYLHSPLFLQPVRFRFLIVEWKDTFF